MKVIVTTSDDYRHLVPEFAERFNRYWGSWQEVTVLCYRCPPLLPSNFEYRTLGDQPPNKDWTTGMIPYFQNLKSDMFCLFTEDLYLTEPVNMELMEKAWDSVDSGLVDKFDLTTDRTNFPHEPFLNSDNLVISDQTARYRSSLQVAIWRRDYFRRFLVANRTPWEFELLGEKEAMNDKAVILGTRSGIMKYEQKMVKGREMEI